MNDGLRLFPEQASTAAPHVDLLFYVLIGLSLVFAVGVTGFIVYYVLKYRHGRAADRSGEVSHRTEVMIELTWMGLPLLLGLGVFAWAAKGYLDMMEPPPSDAVQVLGLGRQWMWAFQHADGTREINTLHVPTGRPVTVTLVSEDVIHSFYVPAFRLKHDVVPGRTVTAWFEATRPGRYHLFCAEYCGADHSHMDGEVVVMSPDAFSRWLALGETGGSNVAPVTGRFDRPPAGDALVQREDAERPPGDTLTAQTATATVAEGAALFARLRCADCHRTDSTALYPARAPALDGVYGHAVRLQNERTVLADEGYLLESILYPQAKLVQGYPAIMPDYRWQISEAEAFALVAYLKSLSPDTAP